MDACLSMANVASDDEIESMSDNINHVISKLVKYINSGAQSITSPTNERRVKVDFEDAINGWTSEDVTSISIEVEGESYNIVELLDSLYHISISDSVKYKIFQDYGMSQILEKIIYNGNSIEIEYGLKVLWQLAFDKKVIDCIKSNQQLLEKLKELSLSNDLNGRSRNIITNSKGILWLINIKQTQNLKNKINSDELNLKTSSSLSSSSSSSKKDNPHHIMISYNRESRDLCIKIKKDLEAKGYKVWIDIENITGSSLDSMAKAIENSMCVIVSMTEKYKLSAFCRAEAEYSFNINKPIIPLIMQENYRPDGW
jgi:hypothetical protein